MSLTIEQSIEKNVHKYLTDMERTGFYFMGERRYDALPWDINNGLCYEFGCDVEADVEGAIVLWLDEIDEKYEMYSHAVVLYNGRYYDAECPKGVEKIEDLPFMEKPNHYRPGFDPSVLKSKTRLSGAKSRA